MNHAVCMARRMALGRAERHTLRAHGCYGAGVRRQATGGSEARRVGQQAMPFAAGPRLAQASLSLSRLRAWPAKAWWALLCCGIRRAALASLAASLPCSSSCPRARHLRWSGNVLSSCRNLVCIHRRPIAFAPHHRPTVFPPTSLPCPSFSTQCCCLPRGALNRSHSTSRDLFALGHLRTGGYCEWRA